MYLNYYELEKLMEMRIKEAREEARRDAMAREVLRNQPRKASRWQVWLGNRMIAAGKRLAGNPAAETGVNLSFQEDCISA